MPCQSSVRMTCKEELSPIALVRHRSFTGSSHQLICFFPGNHAQALALAAKRFNTVAHIVMPSISTPSKIAATKGYGAHVYFSGSTEAERLAVVEEVKAKTGAIVIPPADHPDIIIGQGTIALELEEQVEELINKDPTLSAHRSFHSTQMKEPQSLLDAVIAPLGGGGMLSGIATALAPTATRVYGAEPSFQGADDGRRGLEAGRRIEKVSSLTIADGLRTPVGRLNWEVISDPAKVNGVFSVSEEQIKKAMRIVMERLKMVIEPSSAVGLAVIMFDEGFRGMVEREGGEDGWNVGVILSGGNVAIDALGRLLSEGEEDKVEREVGMVGVDGSREVENVPC